MSTGLILKDLAAAVRIITPATVSILSENIIKIDLPRKIPLSVEIRKPLPNATPKRKSHTFVVHADNYMLKSASLTLSIAPDMALAQALGYIYRHVVCIYLSRPVFPPLDPKAQPYVNRSWSPYRITGFAIKLVTQSHPTSFKSIMLSPESIDRCTIQIAQDGACSQWNVHVLYMQEGIQLVKRKQPLQRSTHRVDHPTNIKLEASETGFRWTGIGERDVQDVLRGLWITLASIL
jgi:hypothetical protein